MRERITQARRWVIKVGSSLLTAEGRGLDHALIQQWCEQIAALRAAGSEVVLVSSGSIAAGLVRMDLDRKPSVLPQLQAAAALGQTDLIDAYQRGFQPAGLQTAQVLLTHADLANRQRYLNARATLRTLLDYGAVPIVNENDTVTTAEIRFGDNDTLAALVANLISADVLVILTDQEGLYTSDPRRDPDASLLDEANATDPAVQALAGPAGTDIGSGGMRTKITAAERAAESGTTTVIASGRCENILTRLAGGETLGTMLNSDRRPRHARKQWLANQLQVRGKLQVDAGAAMALQTRGVSLLAVGVIAADGNFKRGELVSVCDPDNVEVGRGLVNYSSEEVQQLVGRSSSEFAATLGYAREPELINRDNMVLSAPAAQSPTSAGAAS